MAVLLRLLVLLLTFVLSASFVLTQNERRPAAIFGDVTSHRRTSISTLYMSTIASTELLTALKKPSKTLAVSLEHASTTTQSALDLVALSMQLRKVKASAIWTSDVQAAKEFVQEQETAKGNFPGPCPIVYTGNDVEGAIEAGAAGVVLCKQNHDDALTVAIQDKGIDIIWEVNTVNDVTSLVETVDTNALAFLVDSSNESVQDIVAAIPEGSIIIASVDAMQHDNVELETGMELKSLGCTSILVKRACVGDGEDVEYATFVVDGLTRKKSRSFNMTGLTGSTNGHFGGVATTGATTWLRTKRSS